jgi:hypothetical protein
MATHGCRTKIMFLPALKLTRGLHHQGELFLSEYLPSLANMKSILMQPAGARKARRKTSQLGSSGLFDVLAVVVVMQLQLLRLALSLLLALRLFSVHLLLALQASLPHLALHLRLACPTLCLVLPC